MTISLVGTDITPNKTSNNKNVTLDYPASPQAGDLAIVFYGSADTTAGKQYSPPTGWTQVETITADFHSLRMFVRECDGTEGATTGAFTCADDWSVAAWGLLLYQGSSGNLAVDVSDIAGHGGSYGTSHVAPSVIATETGLLVCIAGNTLDSSSYTPPSGMTERIDDSAQGSNRTITAADQTLGSTGATGTRTFTAPSSVAWSAATIVIYEATATFDVALRGPTGFGIVLSDLPGTFHAVKMWNGTAWVERGAKVWDGSDWVARSLTAY